MSFDLQVNGKLVLEKLWTENAALKEKTLELQTEIAALKEQNKPNNVALQTENAALKEQNKSKNAALRTEIAPQAS